MSAKESVRVRFAPSPTGYLHIGNARTALVTWLFARSMGGHLLLRIDDTDTGRSKTEYEEAIEEGLVWLHMDWDEKARQRDRMDRYAEIIEQLKADGRVYACYETPEELALKRKSLLGRGKPPIYDRAALDLSDEQKTAHESEGRSAHWRFKLNHKPIEWNDMVRGNVCFNGADLSDPVVVRENGVPLYHLCSVIDDIDYDITHIVRGEDHVTNTATHVQMFEAIADKVPIFAHLPLISDIEGGKLSKRLGSLSVREVKEEGLEAMAVISLLARLGTSDPIEPFMKIDALVKSFDFSKFSKGSPKLDRSELARLNSKILHEMSYNDAATRLGQMGIGEMDETFWNAVRPNLTKLEDAKEWWDIANASVEVSVEDPDYLTQAAKLLPPEPWGSETWKEWTGKLKEASGRKGKDLFMPLRQALTGMDHGPELGVLLPLLGAEKVKTRLMQHKKAA